MLRLAAMYAATSSRADSASALERDLDAVDGKRTQLQAQARADLTAQGHTLTRTAVLTRAVELLHQDRIAARRWSSAMPARS